MEPAALELELLLDLGALIAQEVELDRILRLFEERVARALDAERATLWLLDSATGGLRSRAANLPELASIELAAGRGLSGHVARTGEVLNLADVRTDPRWAPEIDGLTGYETRSALCAPIRLYAGPVRGVLEVLNARAGAFGREQEAFLLLLGQQVARALEYTTLRGAPAARGVPWRGPINHVVGASAAMASVYQRLLRVAATEATVLLRGETGTGKGVLARALHANSSRASGPFVVLDGTSLPASLVESELFGHERGAYTGADRLVPGKVEVAAGGTLFLDEIAEIPLELQGKLLRFLQERRFERVGGRQTLAADVRLCLATNRDLEALVKAGRLREDLYFRARVVEIALPPLRARGAAEARLLAEHFLDVFARRYGRDRPRLSARAVERLGTHRWPGNVRELEHAIERAVVLGEGAEISAEALGLVDLVEQRDLAPDGAAPAALPAGLTLDEISRRYAAACLARHGGNRTAAARELGIGRNTLARLLGPARKPSG